MSYDLHITRKEFWADEEGAVITVEEWMNYLAGDPQLRPLPNVENYKVTFNINSISPEAWLEWDEGEIRTTGADEWIIAKMILIATALDAKVQGDEGEIYASGVYREYIAKLSSSA